ncbi:NUDIX domain-containing protein [Sulfitobacter geojensis]|uniref:NUDIX hydrolase n=1 Tax=Sulfitobacter geojensis TaxID=1342299 RepID=A0AAE3B6S4_9RHOB|nr:NUDIX hydrolase [Sulfitobacter geojensis]MBM1690197.1 NUDIX hydrolase [Sulfitobacter geojensis]MBM1694263.1 NUDIX hydrolase [Sulfitobacter geojensis]MBM1706429.1 NUDIX hydrolase [Sulfitobacter geojensis]MBM1710487.1 NUDIX hydrolase [Sulfitobacter geojensis]MBM1714553.1 NUDIX hydrolase [Sulfitobacter geojensis]
MPAKSPRLAARALILHDKRLLMVNAFPDGQSDLLCAPGGGVEPGASLPDNLRREVFEETGLTVRVGDPCLVNEFHNPPSGFHQVDIYFRCTLTGTSKIDPTWQDSENVVTQWHWLTQAELGATRHKPDSLSAVAFGGGGISYDPLELLVR